MSRKAYPSDVTDEEWAYVAPYLILMKEDAPQREHDLREVFNGLRWIVRTGSQWRLMPHDLPPWYTVYQQAQGWITAGVFEDMVHDLRALLRLAKGKNEQPSAAIFDGRTVQSTPESGERAGYDGYKRKKGSKIHLAVDTLGLLLAAQSHQPTNRNVRKSRNWQKLYKKQHNILSKSLMLIKATPAMNPNRMPKKQVLH